MATVGVETITMSTELRDVTAEGQYRVMRTNPRFPFFAEAEVTLRDGTSVPAQLEQLSARGCYIDALEPIPVRTKMRLRISDGMSSCEVHGKVIYMHSGGGLGIFGMGVLFDEIESEQHSTLDAWLHKLAKHSSRAKVPV